MLKLPAINPPVARLFLLGALIAITVLSLLPMPAVPASTGWDKADHWLGFFVLALLAAHAYPRQPFWLRLAPMLVLYGIAIEVAQSYTPDRVAEWRDVIADAVGIAAYGLLRFCHARLARAGAAAR